MKQKNKDVECAFTIDMPADDQPLPKLPDDYGKKQEFLSKRSVEDLLTDTVIIGRRYKKFREFFADYGDMVEELRKRLPKSGSKCKIGVGIYFTPPNAIACGLTRIAKGAVYLHSLLGQAIEQFAARGRLTTVEAKGELVEILVQVMNA